MLTVIFKKKRYAVPSEWRELTPENSRQFVRLCGEMARFEAGVSDIARFRLGLVLALMDIDVRKIRSESAEMNETFFRMGEMLTFPYVVDERDGRYVAAIDIRLSCNLLPKIRGVAGYEFCILPDGQVRCSLTADNYIDALGLMQAFQEGHDLRTLRSLAELLYPGIRKHKPSEEELYAIWYNLRGILDWIRALPTYSLIFASAGSASPSGNPVGLSASIFQLAKAGYGDIDTIRRLNLFNYLDLLVQQTVESIRSFSALKMGATEIADRMHLPVALILPVVQDSSL